MTSMTMQMGLKDKQCILKNQHVLVDGLHDICSVSTYVHKLSIYFESYSMCTCMHIIKCILHFICILAGFAL